MELDVIEKARLECKKTIATFEHIISLYSKDSIDKTIKGQQLLQTLEESLSKHERLFKSGDITIEELYDNIISVKNLLIWIMKKDIKYPDTNLKNLNEMKRTELKQIIKEEIQKVLNESHNISGDWELSVTEKLQERKEMHTLSHFISQIELWQSKLDKNASDYKSRFDKMESLKTGLENIIKTKGDIEFDAVAMAKHFGLNEAKSETEPSLKPPKKWWNKMQKSIKSGNPKYSQGQVDATIGAIWSKLSKKKKTELREKEGKRYGKAPVK